MIYAGILAGGTGSRLNATVPKQFLKIGGTPIFIETTKKMLKSEVDVIVIGCHADYIQHAKDEIAKYLPNADKEIIVCEGGSDRLSTLVAIMDEIEKRFTVTPGDIFVTHDSVRPFVTVDMLNLSIKKAVEFGACNTVTPATDTIVISKDGDFISSMPDRSEIFLGQCPQTFNFLKLKELIAGLSDEQKSSLTDACKIFTFNDLPVALIPGDASNFKITTMGDYDIASAMAGKYLGENNG